MYRRFIESLREVYYTVRGWLHDWRELALSPIRSLREFDKGNIKSEFAFGGYQAIDIVRGFLYHAFTTVVGFLWFLAFLPLHLYRGARFAVAWVYHFVREAPRAHVALVLGVAAFVVVGVGGPAAYLLWERRVEGKRTFYYSMLDQNLKACDAERAEETLTNLLTWAPNDDSIPIRLKALRDREGPASDPDLLRLIMRGLYREGKIDLAAREAGKLIETHPDDWESRCMLADAAARRNDTTEVQKQLAELPSAADVSPMVIPPWVAWYGAQLFHRIGETERLEQMIDFIARNVLPIVRGKDVIYFETGAKLLLIDCYRIALMQLDRRTGLTKYWVPVQTACQSVLDTPDVEVRQLVLLGSSQQTHLDYVEEFARRRLVTAEEAKGMRAEVEARVKAIWDRVMALDPTTYQSYIGLAEHAYRAGRHAEALAFIDRGLQACGQRAELVADKALLLRRIDPHAGAVFLDRALDVDKLSVGMCQVYAQAMLAAGRPDKAIDACRQALKLQPGLLWAARTEAEICLMLNRPTEAAAALKPVREFLATDPHGCAQYIKALSGCGSVALAEQFLDEVHETKKPVEVELEGAQAFLAVGRPELAVRWAKKVLDRDSLNVRGWLIVGDGLRAQAELPERGWNLDLAREALEAYRAVLRQQDRNLAVINNIVWLELKAMALPRVAYESSAKLRERQNDVTLPAEYMETLGALYIANGEFAQARDLLKQALSTAGPRVSFYVHLAQAYIGLDQPLVAEKYLMKAFDMPKTPRETAEVQDAARQLHKR